MGEVYRAKDKRLDRTVAIKILPAQFTSDPLSKQRFEREAKVISSLNHPNICSLFDVGSQDGMDFLVMECIEGESLAQRLAKGALPTDQVLKIGNEIADEVCAYSNLRTCRFVRTMCGRVNQTAASRAGRAIGGVACQRAGDDSGWDRCFEAEARATL